ADLTAQPAGTFEAANLTFWHKKLDGSGMQAMLPPVVQHLWAQYRSCRADLLILADDGELHPGPTIYDSFWIATPAWRPSPAPSPATTAWRAPSSAGTTWRCFRPAPAGSGRPVPTASSAASTSKMAGNGTPTARRCGRSAGSTGSWGRPRRSGARCTGPMCPGARSGSGTAAAPTASC